MQPLVEARGAGLGKTNQYVPHPRDEMNIKQVDLMM